MTSQIVGLIDCILKCNACFISGSSPYYVPSSEIPVGQGGLLFVAVAFTGNRPAAIATKVLKKPVIPTGKLIQLKVY